MKSWHIGCSGFYYREWKEKFYPKGLPQKDWFHFYCQHFNTIEINNSFYRFPELKNLQGWFSKAPDGFVFSIKVPQTITHHKKFEGTVNLLKEFYDVILNGLQSKLGPVLFQLPPGLSYSADKLNTIISQLEPAFINVIEFRHASWWQKGVIEALSENNIVFCGVSYPGLNDDVIINHPCCYYRFHGVPKLYYSEYTQDFLSAVVQKVNYSEKVEKAFLYFNNTASAAALDNARAVQALTGEIT